jgi:hypothetical protein
MGRCAVRLANRWLSMSGAEKPMEACAWCMQPASAVAVRVPCATSVNGSATQKPRQVSVLLHPLVVGSEPLLWRDWGRRSHRRTCIQLVRHQWIKVEVEPPTSANLTALTLAPLSRAQRAHYRLSWAERLARNARPPTAGRVTIKLFGVPQVFATWLGLTAG